MKKKSIKRTSKKLIEARNGQIMTLAIVSIAILTLIIGGFFYFFREQEIIYEEETIVEEKLKDPMGVLTYNGTELTDHRYIIGDDLCVAENLGMEISIYPCNTKVFIGTDIENYVDFTWNGGVAQDTSWVFVYEGELESGEMTLGHDEVEEYVYYEMQERWVNDYVINGVTDYSDISPPTIEDCELGTENNSMMYEITQQNSSGIFEKTYCFSEVQLINATTYSVSGNASLSTAFLGERTITVYDNPVAIEYMGSDLLGSGFSYYQVLDVTFEPDQTYKTKWSFTPVGHATEGKWHIFGYDSQYSISESIDLEQYIYVDPTWTDNFNDGILAYYKMDDTVGVGIEEIFGHNFTVFYGNVTRGKDGLIDNAYQFEGSGQGLGTAGDYVETFDISQLPVSQGTISMWLNWTETETGTTIYPFGIWSTDGGNNRIELILDDREGATEDRIRFYVETVNVARWELSTLPGYLNGNYSRGEWMHFAITHNGSHAIMYINGTAVSGQSYTVDVNRSSWIKEAFDDAESIDILSIGTHRSNNQSSLAYNGSIDEMGIWNRSLTALEISDLYNGGAGITHQPSKTLDVALNFPADNSEIISDIINFTATLTAVVINNTNATFYLWNDLGIVSSNLTNLVTGGTNQTNFSLDTLSPGNYSWNVLGCAGEDGILGEHQDDEAGAYLLNDNDEVAMQTFHMGTNGVDGFNMTKVRIGLFKVGTPGALNISLRSSNGSEPVGAELTSGFVPVADLPTVEGFVDVNMTPYVLLPDNNYSILVRPLSADSDNRIWVSLKATSYAGGNSGTSNDDGVTWDTSGDRDLKFQIRGEGSYICEFALGNFSFDILGLFTLDSFIPTPSFETKTETFIQNVSIFSGLTITDADFIWNGTNRGGLFALISGQNYSLTNTFDIPAGTNGSQINTFWNITLSDGSFSTTNITNMSVDAINLSICGGTPIGPQYINISYKNETPAQEDITAFVSTSTWYYWLGEGTENKTFSFVDATERTNHTFCFYPGDHTINAEVEYRYDNAESQQRIFSDNALALTNTTNNKVLWLLPTSEGIFVTFQIINIADQPINGATVTLSRTGFGTVAQEITGPSGTVSVFLNPNFVYTILVEATGFDDFSATQAFTTTEFTIQLGSITVSDTIDLLRGISFRTNPKVQVLKNATDYNFNFTINSSFWNLELFGFDLTNRSGSVHLRNTSTASTGGFVSVIFNTGNETTIEMHYFWRINGSYVNATTSWGVHVDTPGSISGFFTRLRIYMGEGIFGINQFGMMLIIFLIMFLFTGVLAFKFGLTSPEGVVIISLFVVALFDAGLNLIPSPFATSVRGLPTIITLLIFIAVWLRRNQ